MFLGSKVLGWYELCWGLPLSGVVLSTSGVFVGSGCRVSVLDFASHGFVVQGF